MAIKVSGTTVIDDSRNIQNVGIVTATTFNGNITGTTATFTGNVSIAGTLSYEDVTNVDSVGLVTARTGVRISGGGLTVVGVTTVSAGSTSAPAITPTGDDNTGVFFPSADTIAFTEGGVESARVNSSGNLLVGTTSDTGTASQRLQVNGGAYVSGNLGLGLSNPGAVIHSYAAVSGGNPSTSGTTDANVAARFQGGSVNLDIGVQAAGHIWLQPRLSTNFASNFNILLCPNGGNIGIATASPTEKLHVIGNILASGNVTGYSDETLKDNVKTIPDALSKVTQLRGVEFDRNDIEGNPHQIGVIAQEVEQVIPEVVTTHDDGIKSVAYGNLVGVLIEAIKELKEEVNELKARLEEV